MKSVREDAQLLRPQTMQKAFQAAQALKEARQAAKQASAVRAPDAGTKVAAVAEAAEAEGAIFLQLSLSSRVRDQLRRNCRLKDQEERLQNFRELVARTAAGVRQNQLLRDAANDVFRKIETTTDAAVEAIMQDVSQEAGSQAASAVQALQTATSKLKSRRAAAGRSQLLAKRRSNGQMQISAELVPIPDASGMRPGCVGILNSGKFRRILAKFRQNLGNI